VQTYGESPLAENLPSYKIKCRVARSRYRLCASEYNGSSNTSGTAITAANGRLAFMRIPVADGRQAHLAGFANSSSPRRQLRWQRQSARRQLQRCLEDSQWGNDHDIDGSEMLSFCVGSTAAPQPTARALRPRDLLERRQQQHHLRRQRQHQVHGYRRRQHLLVRIEPLSVYAGNSMCSVFQPLSIDFKRTARSTARIACLYAGLQ